VVAEAAAVADECTFERLTLAMVAKRLSVGLPSLYKHVESLDALRGDIAVQSLHELVGILSAAAAGQSREDALQAVARAYRGYAMKYPRRYSTTVRAPNPDTPGHHAAASAVLDVMFAVLWGYHLEGDDAIDAIRAIRAALHGWAGLEKGGAFEMPQDVDRGYHRLISGLHASLSLEGKRDLAREAALSPRSSTPTPENRRRAKS
jgi:AcrR family transcriptional regulator